MKTLLVILVLTLVQIVFGSPLEEFDDFESAPLKTRCNKIDKTDRPPLDADGARRCIDGWRNGKWTCPYEHSQLMSCANKYWIRDYYLWKDPNGCWDYCKDCIHEAINENKPGVLCIARKGLAECYEGYWDFDLCIEQTKLWDPYL